MVHHGFGGCETGSRRSADDVARDISERPETIFAHVVREINGRDPRFGVIWEFDPDRLPEGVKIKDLGIEISQVDSVRPESVRIYIIQRTYQDGNRVKKPMNILGQPEPLSQG